MASYRKRSGGWRAEIAKLGVRESQTFPTKAQAVAWATQREAEIHAAGGGSRSATDFTLKDALEKYRDEVSPERAGSRWEIIRLNRFIKTIEFVGDRIGDITDDQIRTWRDARALEIADPSVRREMTLLSSVFEFARTEWRWLKGNPVRDVKRPSNGRPRDRRISAAEERDLLAALGYVEGEPPASMAAQVAYLFLLAIETAMRQGELLSMTTSSVRLAQRYVRLEQTKNGDTRNVPLSRRAEDLLQILICACHARGTAQLFSVTSGTADALFRRARDSLKIEGLRFHDTRHEAITRLARKLDMLDLARMSGHRDPRALMIYYNATATEVAERLG